jgi:hypothetical protein
LGFGVLFSLVDAEAFKREAVLRVPFGEARDEGVVGEDDDFNARSKQSRDDVALQEVDDGSAVVGGDEDFFSHVV